MRLRLIILAVAIDAFFIYFSLAVASDIHIGIEAKAYGGRIFLILFPLYVLFLLCTPHYRNPGVPFHSQSAWKSVIPFSFATGSLLIVMFFMKIGAEYSRIVIALGFVLCVLSIFVSRKITSVLSKRILGPDPFEIIHIYDDTPEPTLRGVQPISADSLGLSPSPDDPVSIRALGDLVRAKDGIVLHCSPDVRTQWAFALKCLDVPSEIVIPELYNLTPLGIGKRFGHTSLLINSGGLTWNERFVKRAFDLSATMMLAPLLLPVLALVAIAVKLDSPGPVFFRQERIGRSNRKFQMFKFRSMRTDMQDVNATMLTTRGDQRVTRLGRILRATSLDELPQLFNVFVGDMSLVGPRPHAEQARAGRQLYWEVENAYWHRHVVKPGITGLAQVRGFRGNTFHEDDLRGRLNSDLEYIEEWSVLLDINILFRTLLTAVHKNAF